MWLVDTSAWIEWLVASPTGKLARKYKLATADAIVLASARGYGADLLTCDAHFEGLSGVRFVAKPAR